MVKYEEREISDEEASELIKNLEATIAWCSDELMIEGVYGPDNSKQHLIDKMISVSDRLEDALEGLFYTPEGDEIQNQSNNEH